MKTIALGAVLALLALRTSTYAEIQLAEKQVPVSLSGAAHATMRAVIGDNPHRRAGDIQPTGSMRPTIDENYIVVVEKTPFVALHSGQIVVFRASWTRGVLCHRLVRKAANTWITRGDRLEEPDPYPMSAKTYTGYAVIGAIHKRTGELKML